MVYWYLMVTVLAVACFALHLGWRRRARRLESSLRALELETERVRQRHDEATVEASAQQEVLFNSMSEGVLVLDEHAKIQIINRSLNEMFALRADVRGLTVLEAFRLTELAELLDCLNREHTVEGYELEVPGFEERWLQVNAASVLDRSGRNHGVILVFHDLTRIKQLENTRQEFVANVSHELRTPLCLIKGYVETLLDGAKDDPVIAGQFLQTIEKHTDRLTYLIEDILTISKLESGQIALSLNPVDLRSEVARVSEDLRTMAQERQITIENNLPEGLMARVDADRMEQVFFNLLENAIKYGRRGGQVWIESRAIPGDRLEISIRDDGPGIPAESQSRVFERFYRVDRARSRETGGTGLGLSIVKHIVQVHGGEVWLKSDLGKGTTFFFTLRSG